MNAFERCNTGLKLLAVTAIAATNLSVSAVNWPSKPLGATVSARPMTMLVAGRDHKFFYEAYNDASDINGDGTLDTHFKPGIVYYGLYDSKLCYQYVTNSTSKNQEQFEPVGLASTAASTLGACLGTGVGQWSGNWLNYITTSRIDALRKVLFGGTRDVDTATETVLRRSYIPQDAHSWGKEFHSSHGYLIANYTPLSEPTANTKRHFFGNLTANRDVSCATLNDCSSLPPLLRIRTDVGDNRRVYEWASKERPVLHDTLASGGFPSGTGNEQNFTVRAKVCVGTFTNDCKAYPNGTFKPVGLLHEYGENESMLFGLLGGSYDQHMSGGRLRKVVSSFANEINANTGQFQVDAKIVNTFNALRIRGFNQSGGGGEYWKSNPYADSAKAATEGQLVDWGNPIAEMMYEATRYFSGTKTPTSSFNVSSTIDAQVGLNSVTWDDPYENTSAAKAPYCSRANFLVISDINPSFDSDTVPGSVFNSFAGDLTGLNVSTRGNTITSIESNITGQRFIGQSSALASSYDAAPTAKTITSLGSIRGLAPEEPTKQGSYYSASVAYHAKTTDLRPSLLEKQSIDSYVVALSSPLPRIEAKLPNGNVVNVVPFSKSVSGSNISSTKGNYQPTNQIVDFYIETIANSGAGDANSNVNGGRYYAEFQINFEDVEQGGDHDMDAIAKYVVQANANNTLSVTVTPTYQAGGIQQVMGYVISGTTKDGVYLVARDESIAPTYFLNVPFDTVQRDPGYCDVTTPPLACSLLPTIGSTVKPYVFTPDGNSASLLRDPLWYAAKYGGFINRDNIDAPNLPLEWDADNNGVPDTYFLVQNPLKLREALKRAFDNIIEKSGSGGNIIANSTVLSTDALVYQATFNSTRWSGDLAAYPVSTSGVGANPVWNAAAGIPAAASRQIFYHSDTNGTNKGKAFAWGSLSNTEQGFFNNSENLFNYVRGVRTLEVQNGGTLRDRASATVLGDISHSSPVFVKDTNTVYVGANDGMLHGFDSKTGAELFAHIPSSVMPRLKNLADLNFNVAHEYYVDGDIAVSSKSSSLSANYLVSTLGRGGKGLFALDVSTPASFSATDIKWENFDGAADSDLGYMLGRPVIARMNGGTWVVIVGNGYNSTNGRAVLYVFNLATGALIRKFDTLAGSDNGMASPGVFDANNDGLVDVIYSGDLRGNVWKFDVSSTATAAWTIANGGAPIFVAKDSAGKPQPITAPITVAINTVSTDINFTKRFVFFGTGSYFQTGDPTNVDTQTWYSVIDESATLPLAPVRADMTRRTISTATSFAGSPVRVIEAATAADMAAKRGCFIDLPAAGERMVTSSRLFSLAETTLIGSSIIPVVDQCLPGGVGFLNAINPFTCARLTLPFFDVNDNGDFLDDVANGAYIGSIDLGVGMPGEAILVGNRLAVGGSKGTVNDIRVNPGGGGNSSGPGSLKGRLSWREIVRD